MDLLLDAYMQWFHIGSYRLARYFFSARLTMAELFVAAPGQHQVFKLA
jgi:hypothetical protein